MVHVVQFETPQWLNLYYKLNFFQSGQKMDDLSRIPGNHCPKVFIHRDYTNGTSLCFQLKFPQELDGKVRINSHMFCFLFNE